MTGQLPRPTPAFDGTIERLLEDSTPRRLEAPETPAEAPNVLVIMIDDVGFGSCGTFGGPIPMLSLRAWF